MGVSILANARADQAVLYCSTSDWAFGPVFNATDDRDAEEQAEAFLTWLDQDAPYWTYDRDQVGQRRDVRCLTESGLQTAYSDWLAFETTRPRAVTAATDNGGR